MTAPEPGVYEHLFTRSIDKLVSRVDGQLVSRRALDPADADVPLTRHVATLTAQALRSVRGEPTERLNRQLEIINRVTELLMELAPEAVELGAVVSSGHELLAIAARREAGFPLRPDVSLSASALLMNGHGQPQIGYELQRELAMAHSVDLLCASVKWNGVRVLERQLAEFMERGGRLRVITTTYIGATINFAAVDVRPYPFQREILDGLEAERRVHDRHRNLVVMATGTGKTVVAALDYRRLAAAGQVRSLLFVAHRREILHQSRAVFRLVLRDQEFGELLLAGVRPQAGRHVFASIQSLSSSSAARVDPDDFDMVIVDEFHHAEARTYRELLARLAPKELLGLTATPERTDGHYVKEFFGGRVAVELRLWEAIERGLLAPFQYFGVHDGVDLRGVPWRRGRGYDPAALAGAYVDNTGRVGVVLEALRRKVGELGQLRVSTRSR